MNMRYERKWVSYALTPAAWIEQTRAYNSQLVSLCNEKDLEYVPKNAKALMDKLGDIETQIIGRVRKNNYLCKWCYSSFATETD